MPSAPDRAALARDSLAGLSVGDGLGEHYVVGPPSAPAPPDAPAGPVLAELPPAPWRWTDDTEMACSVLAELLRHGTVDPDRLCAAFAQRCDASRGYGAGTLNLLLRVRQGATWRVEAPALFGGDGSAGNGAAMRVAPLGAWFSDDPGRATGAAADSARVTHSHPDAVAAAVAVALAAGHAARQRAAGGSAGSAGGSAWSRPPARQRSAARLRLAASADLFEAVLPALPAGRLRDGVARARTLLGWPAPHAAYALGNGSRLLATDTVPFALWVAASHLTDYPAAIAACVAAGGDVDTTCAIVGGIVAARTGTGGEAGAVGVPPDWLAAREPLPAWLPAGPATPAAI